ncbi:Uncharacterised protein [Mycobacteroides abscessus subsp. abscessus]|nr:Uncharacterised protein [Mycobacteroides abscessus subsp. abscessus]
MMIRETPSASIAIHIWPTDMAPTACWPPVIATAEL